MSLAQPTATQQPAANPDTQVDDNEPLAPDTAAEQQAAGGEPAAQPPQAPAFDLTKPDHKALYEKAYGEGLAHRSQEIQTLKETAEQYRRMQALAAEDPQLHDAITKAVQRRMDGLPPAAPQAPQPQAQVEQPVTAKALLREAETEMDPDKAAALRERAFELKAEQMAAKVRAEVQQRYEPEVQARQQERTATEWQKEEARLTSLGMNLKDPATLAAANQRIDAARQAIIARNAEKLRLAGVDPTAAARMPLTPREIVNEAFADEFPELGVKAAQAKAGLNNRRRVEKLANAETEIEGASTSSVSSPGMGGSIPYEDMKERAFAAAEG